MSDVRWGILGASKFAREFMGPALTLAPGEIIAPAVGNDPVGDHYHNNYQDPEKFLAAGGRRYREFVQEHLSAFVWVRHLDAGDEADRSFVRVVGDEQVVTGFGDTIFNAP